MIGRMPNLLQNQPMNEAVKFNLPKVQLRIKTTTGNTIQNEEVVVQGKQQWHSVLKQRVKMKKQIQEAYIRSRRHKKNNYIKRISSSRRCTPNPEEKRGRTIQTQNEKLTQERLDFVLQVNPTQRSPTKHKSEHQNVASLKRRVNTHSFAQPRQSIAKSLTQTKEPITSICRPSNPKNDFLVKHFSLYDNKARIEKKHNLELKGQKLEYSKLQNSTSQDEKLEYIKFSKAQRLLTNIVKINSLKLRNGSGKDSPSRIQAWKADKVSRTNHYGMEQIEVEF